MERTHQDSKAAEKEARFKELLLQGLDGQTAAYHEFLKQLSEHLRGFFRKKLSGLPDEVEDLVQETLIAVHRQRHTFRATEPLTAWVHAIARYKLVDLFSARSIREVWNDPLDDELELFSSADSDAAEARRDLDKLLAGLPDKQRFPILHVKLQSLSVVQSAQMTGLSESAVKIGVHRGLKALAAKIKGDT